MGQPPAEPGDEFDFERMTPEEQMAWLESLAKRQGASEDELITAADLDIPVPENVEIDEPGYVPYSILLDGRAPALDLPDEATRRHASYDEPAEEPGSADDLWPAGSDEPEPEAVPVEDDQEEPVAPSAADPMRWLQGISVQPDEDTLIHVRAEEDDSFSWSAPEGETPVEPAFSLAEGDFEADEIGGDELGEAVIPAEQEAEAFLAEGLRDSGDADILDGADAMPWLESTAVWQGARAEGPVTAADFSFEQPLEDAVIDEPGDFRFEASRMSVEREPLDAEAEEPGFADWDLVSETLAGGGEVAWEEPPRAPSEAFEPQEFVTGEEDGLPLLDSSDASDWLTSLNRRSDVTPDEAMTFGAILESEDAAGLLSPAGEGEDVPDALSWLEDLATESEPDLSEYLAVDEGDVHAALQRGHADLLAGMTDEEIERALERGELSGEQELAWLKRQAARLAAAREAREALDSGDLEGAGPASPSADLPAWIAEMRPLEDISEAEAAALLGLESAEPEVPGWLEDMAEDAVAEELAEPEGGLVVAEGALETAEDAALETDDLDLPALDLLSEAVDEFYAVAEQAAEDALDEVRMTEADTAGPAAELAFEGEESESALQQAVPVEMPAWLLDEEEEGPGAPAFSEADMSDWLRSVADRDAPVADDQAWLEALPETDTRDAEMDAGWLRDFDRPAVAGLRWTEDEDSPAREEPVVEAPPKRAVFAAPESEQLAAYQQRLAEAPDDYANRIALARALWALDELPESFTQYEALIEEGHYLPDVVNDLSAFVEDHPAETRIHRMLGDAYLRRGRLKEALYSYRKALEQL